MGEERFRFYGEVRKPETHYYDTWKILIANGISEEEMTKDIEEAERLEKREMELAAKWIEHHNADQSVPEEPSGDIP